MCRFIAYLGAPIFLEELVCQPRHSLLHQSLRAEESKTATQGDGFGIGWYSERSEPAVYREILPAWSDENLLNLCTSVRSGAFFAHVRASTGTAIARQNCHPFRFGPYLFMHNGQIGGYQLIRRSLEALLPDALYAQRFGATDSELMFLLALTRIEQGEEPGAAVLRVFDETVERMRAAGITQALRFCAALTDGQTLHAFRLASDAEPPTLYLRRGARGDVVASEPLDDASSAWQALPRGAVVRLTRASRSSQQAAATRAIAKPAMAEPMA
ncbi:MAG: class II glutamine amidotransferase [Burkholderiaceae bacterium]